MPNYMIWTMNDEVGVNILQKNDDDVDMPDVAIYDADEEPGVVLVSNFFLGLHVPHVKETPSLGFSGDGLLLSEV